MNDEKPNQLIEYRLDQIEGKIDALMDITSRQQEDSNEIKNLAKKQVEILDTLKDHEQRIRKCETQPVTSKAEKWDLIMKTIMTVLATGVISFVLVKVGLK